MTLLHIEKFGHSELDLHLSWLYLDLARAGYTTKGSSHCNDVISDNITDSKSRKSRTLAFKNIRIFLIGLSNYLCLCPMYTSLYIYLN